MEIIGSVLVSLAQSILFYGKNIGISMLLFEIVLNAVVITILYKKNKIKNKVGFLLLIPIILLSSTYFIFANKMFYTANFFIIMLLNILMYAILVNKKKYFKNHLLDTFGLITNTFKEYKEGVNYAKEKSKKYISKNNQVQKEKIKRITKSVLIVLGVVGVVLILLISADKVFANLFTGIGNLFKNINIIATFSFVIRIAIIIIVYVLFLSLLFRLQKNDNKEEKECKKTNNKDSFTIKMLLIALNVVYFIFCIIQLELLAKIKISESFDYASYARTGFFQLMFVSLINFVIILISNKYNEKIVKILNSLLIVFTTIIAISSMYRMYMYEMEYGLTYLRLFVYLILITEIIAFIPVMIHIFNKNFDFIKWSFIICIGAYCIVNYMNLEQIIVSRNINRTSSRPIDYKYIYRISSADSYEIIKERLQKEDITAKEKLHILNIIQKLADTSEELSWQEFNISKFELQKDNIDMQKLYNDIEETKEQIENEEKINQILSNDAKKYIYQETINDDETYFVEQLDTAMGTAKWKIEKLTENLKKYNVISTIEVPTPSKIKFFANGLGFLEKPTNIYCEKSELLITHDSGKTFETIEFPDGVFTLSDPNRKRVERLL